MNDSHANLTVEQVAQFAREISGKVCSRHSPDYESRRHGLAWNGRPPESFPLLIIEAHSAADVVATVNFARHHGLHVHARGTGHSYSAIFMVGDGVLIDLSPLKDLVIDRPARQISVGPGATSGQISAALECEGLAFPVGHGAPVGIGGFLIGGGLGVNSAAWGGMSTFNILSADVVTADGIERHVSAEENADLFWALRGGGPGLPFIVTRFQLRCYDRPGAITSSTCLLRFADLPTLAAALDAAAPALDRRLQIMLAVISAPPELASHCGPEDHGRLAALTSMAFAEGAQEARTMQAALAALPILSDSLVRIEDQATTFAEILGQGETLLISKRYRADNVLCDQLDKAAAMIMRHLPAAPSAASLSLIVWRGHHNYPDAAYSVAGRYFVSTYAQWNLPEDDDINGAWLRHFYDDMASISTGAYINEFDLEGRQADIGRCYSQSAFQRLRALRRQHDPQGVFHNPSASSHD